MRHFLKVKQKNTHNGLLYCDIGRCPLNKVIKKRIIGFWYIKLTHTNYNLSSILYKVSCNESISRNKSYAWLDNVKPILDEYRLSFIWQNQHYDGTKQSLLSLVEMSLKDQYKQTWNSIVHESPKCNNYRIYKTEFKDF